MSKDAIVVTVRLKNGADILAYYCGVTEPTEHLEKGLMLYRPIYIKQVGYRIRGSETPVFSYETDLYSLYGPSIITIPLSEISFHDVASEFFTMYYGRNIGNIIAREDMIQEAYIKFMTEKDELEAMGDTDSMLIRIKSEYLQ